VDPEGKGAIKWTRLSFAANAVRARVSRARLQPPAAAPVVSCGRGLGYRWDRGRGGDCGCWGSAVMMLTAGIEADDG
jgi:hypothetical protein